MSHTGEGRKKGCKLKMVGEEGVLKNSSKHINDVEGRSQYGGYQESKEGNALLCNRAELGRDESQ